MKPIDKLIQLGYEIRLSLTREISCEFKGNTRPDEKEVTELINDITANVEKAADYIKYLVTLKIDTQPAGDYQEWLKYRMDHIQEPDSSLYRLTVKAYDYNKKPLIQLNADITGTLDETGSYLLKHYLENSIYRVIHSVTDKGALYVKLSSAFVNMDNDCQQLLECPF